MPGLLPGLLLKMHPKPLHKPPQNGKCSFCIFFSAKLTNMVENQKENPKDSP